MNIYLVNRMGEIGYDEYDSIVIVANNEEEARILSVEISRYQSFGEVFRSIRRWFSPDDPLSLKVTKIGVAEPFYTVPTVILASFNAG